MGRYGAVQERRYNGNHIAECRGKVASLLQEQRHGSVGNVSCPQSEQTVAERGELHQCPHYSHENACLDGKQIVFKADIPEFTLPPAHFLAVMGRHTEGFNGIEVIDRLHLESHQVRAHLAHLLAVVTLLLNHES